MITNNPASRLYEILETAKSHSIVNNGGTYITGGEKEELLKNVLAVTFNIDKKDEEKIIIAYIKVLEQIEEVKKAMNKIESRSKENLNKTIVKLETKIVNMTLEDKSYVLIQAITDEALTALAGVALALDGYYTYGSLEEENIYDFISKINELINDLDSIEVNKELKIFVRESLSQVNLVLEEYELYGIDGIRVATESGFGRIILNSELSEEVTRNSKLKDIMGRILLLFGNINTATTFVKNVIPIASQANDFLKNFLLR